MIIYQNRTYVSAQFSSEEELEQVVKDHSEDIFGPASIYLPKSLIRTAEGTGTIPDGIVIDLQARRWFIIEAELLSHSVWNHIAPQIAKQLIACSQPVTLRRIAKMVIDKVKEQERFRSKFADLEIQDIDISHFVESVFESKPIVGIPIDDVGKDLEQWAETLKDEVKLWIIRKLARPDDPSDVMFEIPEEYQPSLDTSSNAGITSSRVTISHLLERGLLVPGQKLFMPYRPRGGDPTEFEATVLSTGAMEVLGKTFSAPSYAGTYCTKKACNGWTAWRTAENLKLDDLRQKFLAQDDAITS